MKYLLVMVCGLILLADQSVRGDTVAGFPPTGDERDAPLR